MSMALNQITFAGEWKSNEKDDGMRIMMVLTRQMAGNQ